MANSERLSFSILDHLTKCLHGVSGEKAETLEGEFSALSV